MLDLTDKTFDELAAIVRAIRDEVCKRASPKAPRYFNPFPYQSWRMECNQVISTLDAHDEGDFK